MKKLTELKRRDLTLKRQSSSRAVPVCCRGGGVLVWQLL